MPRKKILAKSEVNLAIHYRLPTLLLLTICTTSVMTLNFWLCYGGGKLH